MKNENIKSIYVMFDKDRIPAYAQKCDKSATECPLMKLKPAQAQNGLNGVVKSVVYSTSDRITLQIDGVSVGDIATIAENAKQICNKCRGYIAIQSKINQH